MDAAELARALEDALLESARSRQRGYADCCHQQPVAEPANAQYMRGWFDALKHAELHALPERSLS